MSELVKTEVIPCPCCGAADSTPWAQENGYTAVRCKACSLIYVNPRPVLAEIDEAVKTGVHRELEPGKNAFAKRVPGAVPHYRGILKNMFADVWREGAAISWLDVGAGYGEFVEAVSGLAAKGSRIEGIEPMTVKAESAKKRGLNVREGYLCDVGEGYDAISLVNVFSHVPEFSDFLEEIKAILQPRGHFFLETGNIADLGKPNEVPTELDLPDHLVFAGEAQIKKFLRDAGFEIVSIERRRKDSVVNFAKNIGKKILGRPVYIRPPYTSHYRTMLVRARLL